MLPYVGLSYIEKAFEGYEILLSKLHYLCFYTIFLLNRSWTRHRRFDCKRPLEGFGIFGLENHTCMFLNFLTIFNVVIYLYLPYK